MHVWSRRRITLDGQWAFEVDPHGAGDRHRVWECRREVPDGPPEDMDVSAFRAARVPEDWNRQFSDLAHYEGIAWYHRKVERPAGWAGRRAFLYFEAVNYHATVYWNGERLGEHEGGFTPFEFEVTGRIKPANDLVVRVDGRRRSDGLPPPAAGWFEYGGITRSCWLVLAPKVYVRDFKVTTGLAKKGKPSATVEFEVVGAAAGARARVIVPEMAREVEARVGAGGMGRAELDLTGIALWSPQRPRLYKIEVASEGDRISDEVGFRTVERRGADILINGERVFLRGVCLHEESPRVAGRTLKPRDVDYIFKTARSLGVNFLRLAHYPHGEMVVRKADRLGVLLWEEIPACGPDVDFKSRRTRGLAAEMLASAIERDRNRASVIAWSLASDTAETPERLAALKELARLARRLDPTRLIAAAMSASPGGNVMTVKDPLAKVVDVIGVNQYVGWYAGEPKDVAKLKWRVPAGRPVVMSAFGAGGRAGLRGKPTDRWTEDFQAEVYARQLDMIERLRFVRGAAPWILFDFRCPQCLNRHQQGYDRKGLVSDQGVRKTAYQVVRDRYEAWRKKWEGK